MKTSIPTPSSSTLELGFFTFHYYAICILLGIVAAIWLTKKRYTALGGDAKDISDLAIFVIPAGIIGGRIYHVITSPQKYFGDNGSPVSALEIWKGGLGIWGAISLGALAAFIFYRVQKTSLPYAALADAIAPALLVAQGIGRFGNWFNSELFGRPTNLPWGLEISSDFRPVGYENFTTFHPTFLYEAIWCFSLALLIIKSPFFNRLMGTGSIFFFYVSAYSLGRLFIESIRIDDANLILGLRLNIWVSLLMFLGAGAFFRNKMAKNRQK
jgi:prolipoprotein diacylglyceryl transferase